MDRIDWGPDRVSQRGNWRCSVQESEFLQWRVNCLLGKLTLHDQQGMSHFLLMKVHLK